MTGKGQGHCEPSAGAPHYYPQNQGTYYDVLHQLQALQIFTHHRNRYQVLLHQRAPAGCP